MSFVRTKNILLFSVLVLILAASIGCSTKKKSGGGASKTSVPKPEVVVDKVMQEDVQLYVDVTGHTEPYKYVDITARVPGYLEGLFFESGSLVQEGDRLAQIETDQYEVALKAAKAELEVNIARESLAKSNLERAKALVETRTMTMEEYQSRHAEHQMALANVERSRTSVKKAELDLGYTDIRSPIPGKASKQKIDVGNLVGPGAQTSILTIAQMDPMFVDFQISDKQFADFKARMGLEQYYKEAIQEIDNPGSAPEPAEPDRQRQVQQLLPPMDNKSGNVTFPTFDFSVVSGSTSLSVDYPFHGKIVAVIDNLIKVDSGQVTLRGEVRNPLLRDRANADYMFYPGQICKIRIPYEKINDAILVREEAVLTDLDTKYVLVLKEEDYTPRNMFGLPEKDENGNEIVEHGLVVHRRDIKIGKLLDSQKRMVLSGLEAGETYVIKGVQKARIGSPVTSITMDEFQARREAANSGSKPAKANQDAEGSSSEGKTDEKSSDQPANQQIPVEPKADETKPAETPTETKPAESKPAELKPVVLTPQKRKTDEPVLTGPGK